MTEFSEHLGKMSAEKRQYLLQALPVHLLKADQNERLSRLLTDLDFIEAKCSARLTYDLLNDYLSVSEKMPAGCFSETQRIQLQEMTQFIKGQSHILSAQPLLTFQQAANQPPETTPNIIAYQHWERGNGPRSWLKVIHREASSNPALISLRTNERPISTSLSFSGDRIAICDGNIWVYLSESGQEIYHRAATPQRTYSVIALSPDGNLLACAERSDSDSDHLSILNIEDQTRTDLLTSSTNHVLTLRFSTTGKLLAIGGTNGNGGVLAVWDLASGSFRWKRVIPGAIVRRVVFLPGDLTVIAGQGDGICSFWNSDDGKQERSIVACAGAITDLSVSHDGKDFATSSQKHTCQIISIHETKKVASQSQSRNPFHSKSPNKVIFSGHFSTPSAIAFLDDSKLISGDIDGVCHIWNAEDGKLVSSPISGEGKILSIEVSGNQESLLITSVEDQKSQVFATKPFLALDHSQVDQGGFLYFLGDFMELARARQDGTLEFFSVINKTTRKMKGAKANSIPKARSWTVSPDKRYILSADTERAWKIWDYKTNEVIQGTSAITIGNDVKSCVSSNGQSISLFSQEQLELISVYDGQSVQMRLPMIVGAMRFLTQNRLEIIGINLGLKSFPPESVVYIQVDPSKQYADALYSGQFGDEPMRGSSTFQFSGPERFIQCGTITNGKSMAILWDSKVNRLGSREFSTAVKVQDVTTDGKWVLVSQPSNSMCYLLDASSQDLRIACSYPVNGSILSSAIQEGGDLIAFDYSQGGLEVLQRISR